MCTTKREVSPSLYATGSIFAPTGKNYPKMSIRSPFHDTCAEYWKYRNELGVVSRLQNEATRREVRGNFDGASELENNTETNFPDNDEDSINHDNDNNNQIESYTPDMMEESIEGLCPPFVRAVESIVSKFKVHVEKYSNMRKLVKEKIDLSREHELSRKEWSSRTIVQIADFAQNLDLPHFGSEQPGDIYYFSPLAIYLFGIVSPYQKMILCSVNITPKAKERKEVITLYQCYGTISSTQEFLTSAIQKARHLENTSWLWIIVEAKIRIEW